MSFMSRFREVPRRPLVLLLGWLGSRRNHFDKYTSLYQDLGAHVIGVQPTILQTAVPALADRGMLQAMQQVAYRYSSLCTMVGDTPPVMVHAMSNTGFIAYGTMLHLVSLLKQARPQVLSTADGSGTAAAASQMKFDPAAWAQGSSGGGMTAARSLRPPGSSIASVSGGGNGARALPGRDHPFLHDTRALAALSAFRQVVGNTQGIVIDSAPSQATPYIWSRGLVAAVMGKPAQNIDEAHPLMVRTAYRLAERYFMLPQVVRRVWEVRHAWQYSVPPCPQLYLYSHADALIPYQHIERFMDQQEAHGVPVHHHCWDDSAHCEHYRKHPEQYRSLIRSFTEHCLHSHTPPESWI